jgi:hypothetical protein
LYGSAIDTSKICHTGKSLVERVFDAGDSRVYVPNAALFLADWDYLCGGSGCVDFSDLVEIIKRSPSKLKAISFS